MLVTEQEEKIWIAVFGGCFANDVSSRIVGRTMADMYASAKDAADWVVERQRADREKLVEQAEEQGLNSKKYDGLIRGNCHPRREARNKWVG